MIRELKTFVCVAREGTFAAAGKRVGLTQAAVSAQMKRLEEALGVSLFERQGRSARLTALGRQTLERAQELIRLYEGLASSSLNQAATTLVVIGAIASVQRAWLPRVMARFHRYFPGCRSRVVPGLSMDLINQVDAGEMDMAVVIRPPFSLPSDLNWTLLAREPFRLVVPASEEGSDWRELLSTQPFVRYDRASFGGRRVDRFLRDMHFGVKEICEVDELDAILQLVANHVGVALVPETASLRRWPGSVRAIDLGEHTFHRDIGLVHRATGPLSEPIHALVQAVSTLSRKH
uniref:LysR substrate-binding domain-containing protein n=1 Tax=Halomonas sp. TaxID=1486246 RepID=UPI00262FCC5D|nr:LysR substrate-binding domain-containing protein [Halomonas sp.]